MPNKQNIRRHGWRKQYVVVSSRKIIFYGSESDRERTDPVMVLDLRSVPARPPLPRSSRALSPESAQSGPAAQSAAVRHRVRCYRDPSLPPVAASQGDGIR